MAKSVSRTLFRVRSARALRLRKVLAGAASAGALLIGQAASAHTDALGFLISVDPNNPGKFITQVFYGTYSHGGAISPEGSAQISLNGAVVATQAFALVPGYTNVANGTVPTGLVVGTNYFFVNSSTSGLVTTPYGSGTTQFQSATFTNLGAGTYSFGYVAGALSQQWTPLSPAINSGTFTITSSGSLGGIGGVTVTPDIDTTVATYTTTQLAAGGVTSRFTGGTLTVAATGAVANNFTIAAQGGTIDTSARTLTVNGTISDAGAGAGGLTVKGGGTLVLASANSYTGGTYVNGGVLQLNNLGGAGTGTIHMVDPTVAFGVAGTNANNYSLDVGAAGPNGGIGGAADPTVFQNNSGGTVTLTGAITTGTGTNSAGQAIDPGQYVTFSGSGTTVLANASVTPNNWAGTTAVSSGTTLQGTSATISGGSIVDNGTLAYRQAASGTVAQAISGSGTVTVGGLTGGNTLTFAGANTQSGGFVVTDASAVAFTGSATGAATEVTAQAAGAAVANSGTIVGSGFGVTTTGASSSVVNSGTISSGSYNTGTGAVTLGGTDGVYLSGGGTVTNNAGGTISGARQGVQLAAAGGRVNNFGTITSTGNGNAVADFNTGSNGVVVANAGTINFVNPATGAWGVALFGTNSVITNTGTISADVGIELQSNGAATLTNGQGGTITGSTFGVETSGSGALAFANYGTVAGPISVLTAGANSLSLQAGSTTGTITTDSGNDVLSLYTGSVTTADVIDAATGLTVQSAGTHAAASVGAVDLGAGANTLVLAGAGDDGAANGAAGSIDLSQVANVATLAKQDGGT